jgi:hypothetical protein
MKILHYDDHRPARAAAYPEIGEQLDALWKWFAQNQTGAPGPAADMLARINAVKAKYPKPPNVE